MRETLYYYTDMARYPALGMYLVSPIEVLIYCRPTLTVEAKIY